jgi:hypothetical protein
MQHTNDFDGSVSRFFLTLIVVAMAAVGCGESPIPAAAPLIPNAGATASPTNGGKLDAGAQSGSDDDRERNTSSSDRSDKDAGTEEEVSVRELLADGEDCEDDLECASSHCNNDLCCSGGDCCLRDGDCASDDGVGNVCDYASTCQGSRGDVVCVAYRCATEDGRANDSACDEDVEADDCGPYQAVYCNGQREQEAPQCLQACTDDAQCDIDAFCENGVCVRDVPAVEAPTAPTARPCMLNSDCASGEMCRDGACFDPDAPPVATGAASESCLETLGASNACNECACTSCADTVAECWNSGTATRDMQCSAMLECALAASCINPTDCTMSMSMPMDDPFGGGEESYGCFGRDCYCGDDCYVNPNGACVAQIRAAAGATTVATTISTRTREMQYAVYYAERHAQCLQENCSTQCGL